MARTLSSRLETQALTLAPLDQGDAPRMRELAAKYRDLPMDLADAALVRVAELESLSEIFTLDRKRFPSPVRDAAGAVLSYRAEGRRRNVQ